MPTRPQMFVRTFSFSLPFLLSGIRNGQVLKTPIFFVFSFFSFLILIKMIK